MGYTSSDRKAKISRAYEEGVSIKELVSRFVRSNRTIRRILLESGVRANIRTNKPKELPTQEEIAERAAKIREKWGTEEHYVRCDSSPVQAQVWRDGLPQEILEEEKL